MERKSKKQEVESLIDSQGVRVVVSAHKIGALSSHVGNGERDRCKVLLWSL